MSTTPVCCPFRRTTYILLSASNFLDHSSDSDEKLEVLSTTSRVALSSINAETLNLKVFTSVYLKVNA